MGRASAHLAPRTHRLVGLASLLAAVALAPAARAQPAPPIEAPPERLEEVEPSVTELLEPPPPRPRLCLAIGMGATHDATGFSDGAHLIPAFFAVGGFGDGLLGIDLGAFASSASGRYLSPNAPVDRLALDAFGVLRPAARLRRNDHRYPLRVLRTVGAELGLGLERDSQVVVSGTRWEIYSGARIEFPLTPAGEASELRLRLAFRRAFGLYTPTLSGGTGSTAVISVGDSTELYAALAVIF
jgi:hypothetical protein